MRLLGSEIVGFNLWIALPFPAAAVGAYLFFRSRCFATRAMMVYAVIGSSPAVGES